jgi:cysteine desulfuration protein SufE
MNIEEIIDNFALFEDWEDKYRYLISLGGHLPPMPESLKTDAIKVRGCMSQVWMALEWNEKGQLSMQADSDALIVRGLVAVLYILFQGKTAEEIRATDIEGIFRKLGLDQHLSPNRRNGFFSMVEFIRSFTAQYK